MKNTYFEIIKEKGFDEVSFQKDILSDPKNEKPELPVVVAVGTGGGKTTMTTIKLEMFYRIKENRGKRTIILSSSTKVLRKNFYDDIHKFNPTFTYRSVNNRKEFKQAVDDGIEVIIVLPQTLNNIKLLPKVEWLVVDEAHKWYFAKTIQDKIIPRCKPTYQWLLTGTPFKFTAANITNKKYNVYYVSVSKMMDLKRVGNPIVSVISTNYDIKHSDYFHNTGEVRNNINFGYNVHKEAFINMTKGMLNTCKNPLKRLTQRDLLQHVFGQLDKTIVYCYSKQQSRAFQKVCKNLGINSLASNSENDIDSVKFDSFKKDDNVKILFVVDRGREGFDMPELFNIVDFTLSTNPEVLLQIIGRVLRISKKQPTKIKSYYKVSPANDVFYHKTILSGVLSLIEQEEYSTFTGKIDQIKVPVLPIKKRKPRGTKGGGDNGPDIDPITQFFNCGINLNVGWWKEIKTKHSDVYKSICWTTLEDVRKKHFNIRRNEWSHEELTEVSSKFDNITDMVATKEGQNAYDIITKYNIWDKVAPHIQTSKRKALSYEECKKIVSTWKELPTRSKGSSKSDLKIYGRIADRGWNELLDVVPRTKRGKKTNNFQLNK